jgi:hypothetical protein
VTTMIRKLIKGKTVKTNLFRASEMLAILFLAVASASAADQKRDVLVLASTNNANGNDVVVFKLDTSAATPAPTLEFCSSAVTWERLPTTDPTASPSWCGKTIPSGLGGRSSSRTAA